MRLRQSYRRTRAKATSSKSSSPSQFVQYKGAVYFVATTDAAGTELWRTDVGDTGATLFLDLIPEGQAAGQIRADIDPKLAALSILGSANWVYTWYRAGGEIGPDIIGRQFATMTVNSLASDEALRKNRKLEPVRAWTASATLSSADSRGRIEVI